MNRRHALPLIGFASYRLTRLVTADAIGDPIRDRLIERWPPESHKTTALLACPFCAGFWITGALLALAHAVRIATWPVREDLVWWWAAAGMQSLMSAADEKLTG